MTDRDTRRNPRERTAARNVLFKAPVSIGGKNYPSRDDLPPEARAKLEQSLRQMRDKGLLEDRNQDGIPDHFELPLRIAGWVGRLIGNPQLGDRIKHQMQALGVTAQEATQQPTSARPVTAATPSLRTPRQPAQKPVSPAAVAVVQRQRAGIQVASSSAVQRSSRELGSDSRLPEFLRKLAIVSAIVLGLYLLATQTSG
jgi:hypothetical protein